MQIQQQPIQTPIPVPASYRDDRRKLVETASKVQDLLNRDIIQIEIVSHAKRFINAVNAISRV